MWKKRPSKVSGCEKLEPEFIENIGWRLPKEQAKAQSKLERLRWETTRQYRLPSGKIIDFAATEAKAAKYRLRVSTRLHLLKQRWAAVIVIYIALMLGYYAYMHGDMQKAVSAMDWVKTLSGFGGKKDGI